MSCHVHVQGPSALHEMFGIMRSIWGFSDEVEPWPADAASRLFAGLVRRGHRVDAVDKVRACGQSGNFFFALHQRINWRCCAFCFIFQLVCIWFEEEGKWLYYFLP